MSFVERSAEVFGDLPAVIHGARHIRRRTLPRSFSALAAALLRALGVVKWLSTVTTMLPKRRRWSRARTRFALSLR